MGRGRGVHVAVWRSGFCRHTQFVKLPHGTMNRVFSQQIFRRGGGIQASVVALSNPPPRPRHVLQQRSPPRLAALGFVFARVRSHPCCYTLFSLSLSPSLSLSLSVGLGRGERSSNSEISVARRARFISVHTWRRERERECTRAACPCN